MAAAARLVVAAACPACAAPLDFTEGASCARCGHCGTRLLLPGRRHVLTYHVPPRTDAIQAVAVARRADPRARDPELCFLPYYRFTGQELRWDWPMRETPSGPEPDRTGVPLFAERAIERNFVGCAWDGFGLYSLGVRASVLRLSLFRPDAVPAGARLVAPEIPADAARAHALRTADDAIAQRAVLCGMLALVYFPCWIVALGADGARFAVVDAVSGALVTADGPPALRRALADPGTAASTPLACRPLACPNCGWELPDDPEHVVFFCTQCARAWELDDARLSPIAGTVAAAPEAVRGPVEHLPMWVVDVAGAPAGPRRIVVPGFRHPSLRLQLTLATQLTRKAAAPAIGAGGPPSAAGASFDRDDAVALARFVAAGIDRVAARDAALGPPRLVWWPFERLPGSLRDPVTRFALQAVASPDAAAARTRSARR